MFHKVVIAGNKEFSFFDEAMTFEHSVTHIVANANLHTSVGYSFAQPATCNNRGHKNHNQKTLRTQ